MDINKFVLDVEKQFKKKFPETSTEFKKASEEKPTTGIIVDNPQLEFILDRRYLAYGRFYLSYGKKGSSKTSLFYDLAKVFQKNGGLVIWLETENAADKDYAAKQGVDLTKMYLQHPESLEEALELAETYIRKLPIDDPDGTTPILICIDSIAGSTTEYELDSKHTIHDQMPGSHARLLSRFYREMEKPLSNEKCIVLMINQLKEKIGAFGFSPDASDSMIGGNAPLFNSTYQFKMTKKEEMLLEDNYGAKRKVGSIHIISCKRNKLGREGKGQDAEVDLYIDGGMDWYSPLVRRLGKDYPSLMSKRGGFYIWRTPGTKYLTQGADGETVELEIDVEKPYRENEMAQIICNSDAAKEIIRKAFGIPDLPPQEVVVEIEKERLSKRKKRSKSLTDDDASPRRVVLDTED